MEAKAALIGANSTVELHAIADVDLHFALVVNPGHAEGRDALRLDDAFHNLCFLELWMLVIDILDAFQHFADCLKVLSLAWMLLLQALHDFLNVHSIKL